MWVIVENENGEEYLINSEKAFSAIPTREGVIGILMDTPSIQPDGDEEGFAVAVVKSDIKTLQSILNGWS